MWLGGAWCDMESKIQDFSGVFKYGAESFESESLTVAVCGPANTDTENGVDDVHGMSCKEMWWHCFGLLCIRAGRSLVLPDGKP